MPLYTNSAHHIAGKIEMQSKVWKTHARVGLSSAMGFSFAVDELWLGSRPALSRDPPRLRDVYTDIPDSATTAPTMLATPGSEPNSTYPPSRITHVLNCPRITCDVADVALHTRQITIVVSRNSRCKNEWMCGHDFNPYPSARAPDHCNRKPSKAEIRIALVLVASHLKDSTPGGSSHGISATKKKIVTGVVFHINLHQTRQPI